MDVKDVGNLLLSFTVNDFLFFISLSLIMTILKALRFGIFLRKSKIQIPFITLLKVYFAGQFVSPLPGGEFGRGLLLKKEAGVRVRYTSGIILVQSFLDAFAAILLVLIGSFFYEKFFLPSSIVLVSTASALILLLHESFTTKFFKLIRKFKYIRSYIPHLQNAQGAMKKHVVSKKTYITSAFITGFLLSLVGQGIAGLLYASIAQRLGVALSFWRGVYIANSGAILQALSILPGGIGTTEGGMVGMTMLFLVPLKQAVSTVLMYRIMTFLFNTVLGFFAMTVFYGSFCYQLFFPKLSHAKGSRKN